MTKDIQNVGVNDHELDLFEGQYRVPNGMSYNSFVILDEKVAVLDTVDGRFCDEWLQNIERTLGARTPDYLVVHHMEPDHSANIARFTDRYPRAVVVASAKAFAMMRQFYGDDFTARRIVVGEGSKLSLGRRELTFFEAPMVHWPEVLVSFDSTDGVLFSADAFGKFGALDVHDDWACEARRYYIGIVGKYGAQVQALLRKLAALEIAVICPLHGPVLEGNIEYYLALYHTWSSYAVESEGVVIAYTSVYGNTKRAVEELAALLRERSCRVTVFDLARCDMTEAVEDAFRFGKLVLATTTYNGGIFPCMRSFIEHLTERHYQNRTVAFIENGSWSPVATKVMRAMLEKSKDLTQAKSHVRILSALDDDSRAQLRALADELSLHS